MVKKVIYSLANKGGVGKSLTCIAVMYYIIFTLGKMLHVIEANPDVPDVGTLAGKLQKKVNTETKEVLTCENLAVLTDQHWDDLLDAITDAKEEFILINSAGSLKMSMERYGAQRLNLMLRELKNELELIILCPLLTDMDSITYMSEVISLLPDAHVFPVFNLRTAETVHDFKFYWRDTTLPKEHQLGIQEKVKKSGGIELILPRLNENVSQRLRMGLLPEEMDLSFGMRMSWKNWVEINTTAELDKIFRPQLKKADEKNA